jgi:hypothetical protein
MNPNSNPPVSSSVPVAVLVLFLLAFANGCSHIRNKMPLVRVGAPGSEVESVLGRNYEEKPYENGMLWVYKDSNDVCVIPVKADSVSMTPICQSIPAVPWAKSRVTYGGDFAEPGVGRSTTNEAATAATATATMTAQQEGARQIASQSAAAAAQMAASQAASQAAASAAAAAASAAAAQAASSSSMMMMH